jgi:hypothetical protein
MFAFIAFVIVMNVLGFTVSMHLPLSAVNRRLSCILC